MLEYLNHHKISPVPIIWPSSSQPHLRLGTIFFTWLSTWGFFNINRTYNSWPFWGAFFGVMSIQTLPSISRSYLTFGLSTSTPPWLGTWTFSTCMSIWMLLLQAFIHNSACREIFVLLLEVYLGEELWGHELILYLMLQEQPNLLS